MGVSVCSADNNAPACESGEVGAYQANGTGTRNEYQVAGCDFCVKKNGFDAAGEGFNKRGGVIGDGFGKREGEVLGDDAVFGKSHRRACCQRICAGDKRKIRLPDNSDSAHTRHWL